MLQLSIEAEHVKLDDDLQKYARKKVSSLEKYIPRASRASARVEVRLKQVKAKDKNSSTCELTLHLPHQILNCSETTQHIYAAIDIASATLREQIVKYKAVHRPLHFRRRLMKRFNDTEQL